MGLPFLPYQVKCTVIQYCVWQADRTNFYRCTVHFDIHKVHTPTNALCIKLDKVLKFTLNITLTCSYMFRSTTIIREPSLEHS